MMKPEGSIKSNKIINRLEIKMKKISTRSNLIMWDILLVVGYALAFTLHVPDTYRIGIGFISAIIFSTCIRNHVAAYKLSGKIY